MTDARDLVWWPLGHWPLFTLDLDLCQLALIGLLTSIFQWQISRNRHFINIKYTRGGSKILDVVYLVEVKEDGHGDHRKVVYDKRIQFTVRGLSITNVQECSREKLLYGKHAPLYYSTLVSLCLYFCRNS